MNPNEQTPVYTTRHYIHDPQSNSGNNNNNYSYDRSRPLAQPYPYYTNNQPPTTVTYVNNRSNYGQQQQSPPTNYGNDRYNYSPQQQQQTNYTNDRSNYGQQPTNYVPPNTNRYPPQNSSTSPARGGGGGIEKTNMMSNESPFIDPARPHEQHNTPRIVTSITSPAKSTGEFNKTLNLSDENPFHSVYGGYHYPSQIDPSKRITTQNTANRSTENKSLNLSDESPFFATYGRYHYPSQIDPQKRITEMPKAAASLAQTNDTSSDNPFNNYQPRTIREYSSGGYGGSDPYSTSSPGAWNRNNPAPVSHRPIQTQRPSPNNYNPHESSSVQPSNPPRQPSPPPVRNQPQKPNSSGPMDKTSLNMSPDNPFAQSYGQHHYPSMEEIKAQKRGNERNTRFSEPPPPPQQQQQQQPVSDNRPGQQQTNRMTEYPETEKKEVVAGKGNTKYTRFDVDF